MPAVENMGLRNHRNIVPLFALEPSDWGFVPGILSSLDVNTCNIKLAPSHDISCLFQQGISTNQKFKLSSFVFFNLTN